MKLYSSRAVVVAGGSASAVYRGDSLVYSSTQVTPATGVFLGQQPQDATSAGGQAQFATSATEAGGGTVSYQWQRKPAGGAFANISGATSQTLTRTGLTRSANNGDAYRAVIVGSSGGTVTTREATLTVPLSLIITQQPTSQTAVNRTASFAVTATHAGGLAISYQWQESTDGQTWGNTPGGTSATLSFSSVPYEYNGKQYRVVVSTPDGETITSNAAVLTVPPSPIQIIQQPTNQTAVNLSATFTVSAAHSQALPMTYQWEESLDGGNVWYLMTDMTGTQLQFASLSYDYNGRMYRVVVSSGVEYSISNEVILTVPPSPVSITSQPQSVSILAGGDASFSVQATHSQGLALSYQWAESDDGGNMWYELEEPSATTNALTLAAVPQAKDGTLIRAEVFDANGQYAISSSATLSVQPACYATLGSRLIITDSLDLTNSLSPTAAYLPIGFGRTVSVSADGLSVAAYAQPYVGVGNYSAIEVFRYELFYGGRWSRTFLLLATASTTTDTPIRSMAMDSQHLRLAYSTLVNNVRRVRVWERNTIDVSFPYEAAQLAPPTTASYSDYGSGVWLNATGDVMAVGATVSGDAYKSAIVYDRVTATTWVARAPSAYDPPSHISSSSYPFGVQAISDNGVSVCVSTPSGTASYPDGITRVFDWDGSLYQWVQRGGDIVGSDASMSGAADRVTVRRASAVVTLDFNGSTWQQVGSVSRIYNASATDPNQQKPLVQAMSSDGSSLVVAEYDAAVASLTIARTYARSGSGGWDQVGSAIEHVTSGGAGSGIVWGAPTSASMSASGNTFVLGSQTAVVYDAQGAFKYCGVAQPYRLGACP